MKNIKLKEDINTIIYSKAWKLVMMLRKLKRVYIYIKSVSYSKKKKLEHVDQNKDTFFIRTKLSTREQDKLNFFKEGGFIEDWN